MTEPFLIGIDNEASKQSYNEVGKKVTDITYPSQKVHPFPLKYRINNDSNTMSNHTSDDCLSHPDDQSSSSPIINETTPIMSTITNSEEHTPVFSNINKAIIAIYDQNRKQKDQTQPISAINKEIIKTLNRRFVYVPIVYIL